MGLNCVESLLPEERVITTRFARILNELFGFPCYYTGSATSCLTGTCADALYERMRTMSGSVLCCFILHLQHGDGLVSISIA